MGLNRDYLIKTNNGKVFRRNLRHLLRRVPVLPTPLTSSMEHQLNQPSTYAEAAGGRPNVTVTPTEQRPAAPSLLEQPPIPRSGPDVPANNTAPPIQQRRRARERPPAPAAPTRRSSRSRPPPRYDTNNPPSEWSK